MDKTIIHFITLSIFLILVSCSGKPKAKKEDRQEQKELQTILDSARVEGTILIYDAQNETYHSNSFEEAEKDYLPASTYKIPNSIIGLELGLLENESTIFKWDGIPRALSIWDMDLTVQQAFQKSCVPCYQELAKKIGVNRMKEYLSKLEFGEMDVREETIDDFWLVGNSQINAFEQIDFLTRLHNEELEITENTYRVVKNILRIDINENYSLNGKTGLIVREEKEMGWFVGYLESSGNLFYFATRISAKKEMSRSELIPLRKNLTIEGFKQLKIIK